MLWSDAIALYFAERDVVPRYQRDTTKRALALNLFAGRELMLDEVDNMLINAFLAQMQAEGQHYEKTVKGYRDAMASVLRAMWEQGLSPHRPERIRTIKVRRQLPQAWTIDEVRTLAKTAKELPGRVHGIPVTRAVWFEAYVQLLWSTGLRCGDVLRLKWSQVRRCNGKINSMAFIAQSKTSHPILCQFSARADVLAERIRLLTESKNVLPWPGARCILDRWFKKLVTRSGIRPGGTRWIRRAAASKVEQEQPGMAGRFLGHLTPGLAAKHYLDPSITNQRPVRPPEL